MTLPTITNKQEEIIHLILRFRFLTRHQIQKLLNHDSSSRIVTWLKDLVEKKYLGRIPEKTLEETTIPARYYLGISAIKYLREKYPTQKKYLAKYSKESKRSEIFIIQCLFIARQYLSLKDSTNGSSTDIEFFTQSDYPLDGSLRKLRPNFVFTKKKKENNKKEYFFCEIFDKQVPRFAQRARIKKYIEFFQEGPENSSPNILFICPEEKYKYIQRFSKKMMQDEEVDNISVYLATYNQVRQQGIAEEIWKRVV